MEINISTEALKSSLGFFGNFSAKGGVAASNYVKVEALNDKLFFYGTDTDVSLRKEINSENFEILEQGVSCIKLSTLSDFMSNVDSEIRSVRIKEEENKWVSVRFGKNVFKIATLGAEHFPEIEFNNFTSTIEIKAKQLEEFIDRTLFAAVEVASNYNLAGIQFDVSNRVVTANSTDGFRIASTNELIDIESDFSVLIPKKAAQLISKILNGCDGSVAFSQNEFSGFITLPEVALSFRKMSGKFPDISIPLGVKNEQVAKVNISALRSAVSRANVFADAKNFSFIKFSFQNSELKIHAQSLEEGIGDEFIPIEYEGPNIDIKFKSNFVSEFLNAAKGENVQIEFSESPKTPTIWKLEGEDNYKCLILKLV